MNLENGKTEYEGHNNSTDVEQETENLDGYLIPVGGGKDSSVTMDLLREYQEKSVCYMINGRGATLESAITAIFLP